MTDPGLVLAIDQGGQSTRAVIFDRNGRALQADQVAVGTQRHGNDRVEHDPGELLDSVQVAVAGVMRAGMPVGAAGLATQRSSIVCWDRASGAPLSPVISWQDRRGAAILQRRAPPAAQVRRITGLVRSPHYGASKLRWCLDNLAAVAAARAAGRLAMGPLASYLAFRLVDGRPFVVDPSNASRTLLWDVHTGDWSEPMLAAFGIPRDVLPRCVASRHAYGEARAAGAPLAVCTGDQGAAVYADGPLTPGVARINIGTGAFVLAPVDPPLPATRLLHSVVWQAGTARCVVVEGTVNGAGSALAEFAADRAAIAAAAGRIGAAGVPLYLNGFAGLGSPWWRDDFVSRFVGAPGDAALTAVLESILFLLQANLDEMAGSVSLRALRLGGGLARVDALAQALADLAGLPLRRATDSEATARGLAFLTAGQPSTWRATPADAFAPRQRPRLAARYRQWRAAMEAAL